MEDFEWVGIKYFKPEEFERNAPEGSARYMDYNLVKRLDEAREIAGIPFLITSAYRTEEHNAEVGGSKTSSHCKGTAVDIAAKDGRTVFIMLQAMLQVGLTRFEVDEYHIHVDTDSTKPKNVIEIRCMRCSKH